MAEASAKEDWVHAHIGAQGLRTEVNAEGHALIADEPESVGGTAAGPNPYGYLCAALASCTSMTLRMYADRKGWPLQDVVTRVRHSKIHAEDCAECESRSGRVDLLEREIELSGKLDEAQTRRLMEIADLCPVHRTLTGEITVHTSLAG